MNEFYHKHYIAIDGENRIIDGFSDAFRQPTDENICINEQGSYQFKLYFDGIENPPLFNNDNCYNYKFANGLVVERTVEEKQSEINSRPYVPTAEEEIQALRQSVAELTFLISMGGM